MFAFTCLSECIKDYPHRPTASEVPYPGATALTTPLGVFDSSLTSLLPRIFEPPAQSFVSRSVRVQTRALLRSSNAEARESQLICAKYAVWLYPLLALSTTARASGGGRVSAPVQDLPMSLKTTGFGIRLLQGAAATVALRALAKKNRRVWRV